jgi:hypothetical protein
MLYRMIGDGRGRHYHPSIIQNVHFYSVLVYRSKSSNIGTKDKETWYKKPWGIVILGVIVTVIGGFILAWII